ncbi:MAG: hypothetical protein GY820_34985, partial [Gammaproteobacteria bacterium]|nr:hypothetical protein [Gammaproteobacteria bacterium]
MIKQTHRKRLEKSKALLWRYASGRLTNLVFPDEKLFLPQQTVNNQSYRILSTGPSAIINSNRKVIRQQKPQAEMVWAAVSEKGRYLLVFVPKGVKINVEFYIKVLEKGLLPWSEKTYGDELYCFQQDGTPAHREKICQT